MLTPRPVFYNNLPRRAYRDVVEPNFARRPCSLLKPN